MVDKSTKMNTGTITSYLNSLNKQKWNMTLKFHVKFTYNFSMMKWVVCQTKQN